MNDILEDIDTWTDVFSAGQQADAASLLIRCRQEIEHLRDEIEIARGLARVIVQGTETP